MLDVAALSTGYGESQVVHQVSFQVQPRQTLAILGRNGMGKTTLFKALIGILPSTHGEIRVAGQDVAQLPSHRRVAAGIGYVPQGRMIFPAFTVEENLEAGLETGREKRVPDDIYALFPVLHEMRRRKGGNLSGGQQQQLAIGRALASRPRVLLLDEPTEGLQPSIIQDIARALNELKRVRELAIVVSEQLLGFALEVADRVAILERGRFVHESERASADPRALAAHLSV
jgi:urea transport system ATP-binding protein